MDWRPSIGDKVQTPDFGPGRVVGVSATRALVALDDLNDRIVSYRIIELKGLIQRQVEPLHEDRMKEPALDGAAQEPTVVTDGLALRAVEAMRFGLVPEVFIEKATLGFDDLSRWIESYLPHERGRTSVCEVTGPFGAGKSHAMAVVRYVAARKGYAVARVEVDGSRVSLSDPAALLCALWSTLTVDGRVSSTPLIDLYVRAIERCGECPRELRRFETIATVYDLVAELMRRGTLEEHKVDLDAFVSSCSNITATELSNRFGWRLRSLIRWSPTEKRSDDFVESLTGHATLVKHAGYQGLVITVDEFEVEYLRGERWRRAENAVAALERYLTGGLIPPVDPLSLFIATVGQEGEETDPAVCRLVEASAGSVWPLRNFYVDQQVNHAMDLFKLYATSYGIEDRPFSELKRAIRECAIDLATNESGASRSFIKSVISLYDQGYGPPDHGE